MTSANEKTQVELLQLFLAMFQEPQNPDDALYCLHIEIGLPTRPVDSEMLYKKANELIGSYLRESDIRNVLFLGLSDVYVFCRQLPMVYLYDLSARLCRLVEEKTGAKTQAGIMKSGDSQQEKSNPFDAANDLHGVKKDQRKVLFVEDDALTRWVVGGTLKMDCDLSMAATAREAIDTIDRCQPDVIFLDASLPEHRENEVIAYALKRNPRACIVMCGSDETAEQVEGFMREGAAGFLTRPFSPKTLLNYINAPMV